MDGRKAQGSRRQRKRQILNPTPSSSSPAGAAQLNKTKNLIRALAPIGEEVAAKEAAANRRRRQTVQTKVQGKSAVVRALAKALALPHDSQPMRWGGAEFANSAVAKLPATYPLTWSHAEDNPRDLPMQDMQIFLFRDPLRSCVYFDPNYSDAVYSYQLIAFDTEELGEWDGVGASPTIVIRGSRATGVNAYKPHGPYMYPGTTGEDLYWWVDRGATITFNATVGGTTTLTYNAQPLESEEDDKILSATVTRSGAGPMAATAITFDVAGYFKLTCRSSASATVIIDAVTFSNRTGVNNFGIWCHRAAPGVDASITSFGAVRVTAASLLVTNIATLVNRGGSVVARQVPLGHEWTDFVAFNGTSNAALISSGSDYYAGDFADGLYGFSCPSGPNDWLMHPYISSDEGLLTQCAFDLDKQHAIVAVAITLDSKDTSGNVLLTTTHHVEFQTDSPIFQLDRSRVLSSQRDEVEIIARDLPQFTENPLHFGQIMDSIRNGAKTAMNGATGFLKKVPGYADKASKGATVMLPVLAALAAML